MDFVMYQVSELAHAARFYREVLGLPQEIYSEQYQWAEFNCGNLTLALHGGMPPSDTISGGCIALAVDNIPAAYDELKRAGARVPAPPSDHGVCRHLDVLDPDGNRIILHQRADGTFGQNAPTA